MSCAQMSPDAVVKRTPNVPASVKLSPKKTASSTGGSSDPVAECWATRASAIPAAIGVNKRHLRLNNDFPFSDFLHSCPCIPQREILPVEPQRKQIPIVRAVWMPGLTGTADCHRVVPITYI